MLTFCIGITPAMTCFSIPTNDGKTSPGQSTSLTSLLQYIVCRDFVLPGVLEALTTFRPSSAFSSDDLPTLTGLLTWSEEIHKL